MTIQQSKIFVLGVCSGGIVWVACSFLLHSMASPLLCILLGAIVPLVVWPFALTNLREHRIAPILIAMWTWLVTTSLPLVFANAINQIAKCGIVIICCGVITGVTMGVLAWISQRQHSMRGTVSYQ